MQRSDVLILGGGIVGLATAYQFSVRHPQLQVTVLEKEPHVGEHQTGRNSGVLHSGIYYKPGSLKALNCRAGKLAMEQFCQQYNVPYEICGKVIVAVEPSEQATLSRILERGQANGVRCELIGPERLAELEPYARGVQAIHVPEAGIVDYRQVAETMATLIRTTSGEVRLQARVLGLHREGNRTIAQTTQGDFAAPVVINCTGLFCDRVAKLAGVQPPSKIVPFRGEYYELLPTAPRYCRNLIYPVPDPQFPFLGVHFTRMIAGGIECGPNAVLAFAREGYSLGKINFRDLAESLLYPGFQRLAWKHWRMGLGELWRSFSQRAFVRALQRLVPEITTRDVAPGRAGVRAQALLHDGSLVDDFLLLEADNMIHVLNAPSPAATSSLQIGKTIVEKFEQLRPT